SPSFSPTPMMSPPTLARGTDSKPPRMSRGSALSAISERLNCAPLLAPHMSPATIATTPATDQTTIQIVLSGTPIDSAASWSSATARSARPMRVRWKNTASTVTSTAAVTAAVSSSWLICTPRTMNERSGIPMSSFLTLAPHTISPRPSRKKLRPIVAMNRMMCAWLTSGRSTSRSIAKASAIMTAVVSASATTTGAPRSSSPTRVSAANSTMTPWAKLNTPEALKMSTKPSATSEYISPAKTPPISTSTRNAGVPAMSLNGATAIAYRSSIMGDAQICVEHRLVAPHLGGRAVGDLPAVVQHDHPVGDVHDHAHVVLDERDRRAELLIDVEDEAAHVLLLLDVHPGHRLVEQQEPGLGGQRPGELDALLQAVGQAARRRLADRLDLQEVDDPLDEGPVFELLTPGRPPVERLEQEASAHLHEPARHDVVEHAHALEQGDVLERARDAEGRDVRRRQVRAIPSLERDPAFVRVIEPADGVEQGRLAGAVGADDRHDLPPRDAQADPVDGDERAESHADAGHLEQRRRGPGHRTTGAGVPTSRITTSARMVPVRPSS